MIRDLLAIVDNASLSAPFLTNLLALADARDAQLEIAVLTPSPYLAEALLPLGAMYVPESVLERDERDKISAVSALAGNASARVTVFGLHDDVAWLAGDVRRSRQIADYILIGGPEEWESPWLRRRVLETIIHASGTPIMILPAGKQFETAHRLALGWKPSAEATRAVHDLVGIAAPGATVDVVIVDQAPDRDSGDEVARHLARHGLKPAVHRLISDGMGDADVLHGFAARNNVDLLVAGGFAHSRSREVWFGGVTRYLIEDTAIPVLLSH